MIFLTVGTQFPFDRLVKAVDDLVAAGVIKDEVFAQIGDEAYQPRNFEAVASLDKKAFDERIHEASALISHAGMGTITMALDTGKPLLAMPRRRQYGEVVNDHQVAIARKFEQLGHLLVAYSSEELADKVELLKRFQPSPRRVQPEAVVRRIEEFLEALSVKSGS
ncbi:MAG TPA: glycosyltransferase [Sedimentisphaerales bacterium]|jgi:UDP-N-acetylglucosamine transferase subunit ALG13|nr:glycosyltransferase [Sedimentisphaerales bacterium]HNU29422.1 glycosyltransferase [Sedimentisphaerales bacterium]